MEKFNLKKYIFLTFLYILIIAIVYVLIFIFRLDYILYIGFFMFSLLPFLIILGILLRIDIINNIKSIYKKNPHLSVKNIASKSRASEDMVLHILSKIKRDEDSSQFKVIQKNSTSIIPPNSFLENTFSNTNKIHINDKCEVNFEGNQMRITVNKSEKKGLLYFLLFLLGTCLICTFLMLQIPIIYFERETGFLLVIVCVMMIFLDVISFIGLYLWFHKHRIIEFIIIKDEKLIILQKISPKNKILKRIEFSLIKNIRIIRGSISGFFIIKLILDENKKIKIFDSSEFGNCRDLGKIFASFLQIPITSKVYSDFI